MINLTPLKTKYIILNHREEFAALKPSLPFGQLPTLEIEGYGTVCQSKTIARLMAQEHNLTGHSHQGEVNSSLYMIHGLLQLAFEI